jgi:hypothetical protein
MSLFLATTKESMLIDPINWLSLTENICREFASAMIPQHADALFRERTPLEHSPRVLQSRQSDGPHCSLYSFYDASVPIDTIKAKMIKLPVHIAKLIDKANQHNPCLSFLGILPNQLRSLLRICKHPDPEAAIMDLSHTLFFSGFHVWSRRQTLAAQYWKSAAPENRNLKPSGRKRKNDEKIFQSNCKSIFHYLTRHSNLSQQRPNRCPCSHVEYIVVPHRYQNIRNFLVKVPQIYTADNSKYAFSPEYIPPLNTQSDAIRREHDRSKKRQKMLLKKIVPQRS